MRPPSFIRSVVDRNVVMGRMTIETSTGWHIYSNLTAKRTVFVADEFNSTTEYIHATIHGILTQRMKTQSTDLIPFESTAQLRTQHNTYLA
jgi:hypothetical protein